jgi:hypothetical protein
MLYFLSRSLFKFFYMVLLRFPITSCIHDAPPPLKVTTITKAKPVILSPSATKPIIKRSCDPFQSRFGGGVCPLIPLPRKSPLRTKGRQAHNVNALLSVVHDFLDKRPTFFNFLLHMVFIDFG